MSIKKHRKSSRKITDITYRIGDHPFKAVHIHETYVNDKLKGAILLGKGYVKDASPQYLKEEYTEEDVLNSQENFFKIVDKMFTFKVDKDNFDPSRVYYIYGSNHMIFDHNMELIPMLIRVDSFSTFTNRCMDLDKALPYMIQSDKFIFKDKAEIVRTPSYNADEYCTHEISEFSIKVDKKDLNDLYQKFKDKESWSVWVKNNITRHYEITKENDVLGIFQFLKPESEIKY